MNTIVLRIAVLIGAAASAALILAWWRLAVGFDWLDRRWWIWLWHSLRAGGALPEGMVPALYAGGALAVAVSVAGMVFHGRAQAVTVTGGRETKALHGTAHWASKADLRRSGLLGRDGVVVGGRPGRGRKATALRHDGPEHVLAFAPTRSGKGVGLVIPTLLSWRGSAIVLDIKGENHALTAGWRAGQGQRVLKFDPTSETGSVRFNPLEEVRLGAPHEVADCQNIAAMIIDPDGTGLKDFWMQAGWEWLCVVILHVLYRTRRDDARSASLADVHGFMSAVVGGPEDGAAPEDGFTALLDDMMAFEHGSPAADREVRRGAGKMRIKARAERSGVHSSAAVQLALYADPIVARAIAGSDFRLADLMDGDRPASLYLVIPPSDIDRLRPLIRVIMNLFLRRLTAAMDFAQGRAAAAHRHRLLLMLDEFTSIGKLEIFEKALAFMGGYGIKAFLIVQDLMQLQQAYGPKNAIVSNCHLRIAHAPNNVETAQLLSRMAGETTIVQRKRSRSGKAGDAIGSVSDSLAETKRPLLTADECMRLPGPRKNGRGDIVAPGEILIFPAGGNPVRGRQFLFFQDKGLLARSRLAPPATEDPRPAERSAPSARAADPDRIGQYFQ